MKEYNANITQRQSKQVYCRVAPREQQQRKVTSIHSPAAIYILQREEMLAWIEEGRILKNREKHWKREENITTEEERSHGPTASERCRGGTDTEERRHRERDGTGEGGQEQELAARCAEQTGKALVDWRWKISASFDKFFWTTSAFHPSRNAKSISLNFKVIKPRGTQLESTRVGKWLHYMFPLQQGGGVQGPLLQREFRPSEQKTRASSLKD